MYDINKLILSLIAAMGLLISGLLGIGLYWSNSGLMTLIISSAFITVACVSTSSLLSAVVALFPTSMRYDLSILTISLQAVN